MVIGVSALRVSYGLASGIFVSPSLLGVGCFFTALLLGVLYTISKRHASLIDDKSTYIVDLSTNCDLFFHFYLMENSYAV